MVSVLHGRGSGQIIRARNDDKETIFVQTEQWSCTSELTVVVKACTRSAQAQARPHPRMVWRGGHRAPPLHEELLVSDSCQKVESPLSSRVEASGRLTMTW